MQQKPEHQQFPLNNFSEQQMRIIRAIHEKTLKDRIRSKHLRELSGIQDIVDWIDVRKRGWEEHVERMIDDHLAKIVKKNRPQGTQSRGRPKKRWNDVASRN